MTIHSRLFSQHILRRCGTPTSSEMGCYANTFPISKATAIQLSPFQIYWVILNITFVAPILPTLQSLFRPFPYGPMRQLYPVIYFLSKPFKDVQWKVRTHTITFVILRAAIPQSLSLRIPNLSRHLLYPVKTVQTITAGVKVFIIAYSGLNKTQ